MVLRAMALAASIAAPLVMGQHDLSAQDVPAPRDSTNPIVNPAPVDDPRSASATQNKHLRKGLWFSGGVGYGSLGCQGCIGRDGSYSGGLALGGTISQKVVVGVGTNGWYQSQNGVTASTGTLTAMLRYYPSAIGGLFLLAGIGAGNIHVHIPGLVRATETGMGFLLGMGYDIRVGPGVSLTPYWNGFAVRTHSSDSNVGQIGLGFTVH